MSLPMIPMETRFWSHVNKTRSCWLWTGNKRPNGYGRIGFPGRGGGAISVHRYSFLLHNGQIPKGMCVLHKCDVRLCVNPFHLFLGSEKDNVMDRERKGRGNPPI